MYVLCKCCVCFLLRISVLLPTLDDIMERLILFLPEQLLQIKDDGVLIPTFSLFS